MRYIGYALHADHRWQSLVMKDVPNMDEAANIMACFVQNLRATGSTIITWWVDKKEE